MGKLCINSFYPLFQFVSLELLCSLIQCRSPVQTHFQVGKLWLILVFSFLSCHATVVLRLCGWCDVVIAVNACISLVWNDVGNYCRKTVVRPANLAQASWSRLGETNRDSPKPFFAKGCLGDQLIIFERASISPGEKGLA